MKILERAQKLKVSDILEDSRIPASVQSILGDSNPKQNEVERRAKQKFD